MGPTLRNMPWPTALSLDSVSTQKSDRSDTNLDLITKRLFNEINAFLFRIFGKKRSITVMADMRSPIIYCVFSFSIR